MFMQNNFLNILDAGPQLGGARGVFSPGRQNIAE